MIHLIGRLIHPSQPALKRYADGEVTAHERPRVAQHLAHCPSCRARVQFFRDVRARVRELSAPTASAASLERIRQRLRAGEIVLLPAPTTATSRTSIRVLGTAAAVVLLALGVWLLVPQPNLTAGTNVGELRFSPTQPRAGARVAVEYRSAADLSAEKTLLLRARYRTTLDEGYNWSMKQYVAATLVRDGRGVFRGMVQLPDSVVYAAFAVEDTAGRRVDSNGRKLWELLIHDEHGRPTFDALTQRANDLHGRDWELALVTAEQQAALYPDRPETWGSLMFFQEVVRGEAYLDSVMPSHIERLREFHGRLSGKPALSIEEIAGMWRYVRHVDSARLDDAAILRYWRDRFDRDSSEHRASLVNKMGKLLRRALDDSLAAPAALASYETLWQRDRQRLPPWMAARFGWQIARETRDPTARLQWSDRLAAVEWNGATWIYSSMGRTPSLRDEALDRLRKHLRLLDTAPDSLRPLYLTREEFTTEANRDARDALVTVGEILLELGHVREGLDTLDLATRDGWDVGLFRRAATARLSAGDSAGAARALALVAADPGSTRQASDSLRRLVGFNAFGWRTLVDSARATLPARIAEKAVHKRISRPIRVARPDGTVEDFMSVVRGRPTVVVFWSRYCGFAVIALPRIEALKRQLADHGISLVLLINEPPSDEFRHYASEKAITPTMYHDSWSEGLRAFNAAGSPLYFVLDASGTIRFEYTELDRVLAEAVAVAPV
jgi:predicted anti-sigma-YlaC factor YlaD